MNNMKKNLLFVLLLMLSIGVQAQIPQEVKDIMKKCSEKFKGDNGLEFDMKLHLGAVIVSMDGTMKICKKGDKSFSVVQFISLGWEFLRAGQGANFRWATWQ